MPFSVVFRPDQGYNQFLSENRWRPQFYIPMPILTLAFPRSVQPAFPRFDAKPFFQQMHLISNLSIYENITVSGYLNKEKTAKEIDLRADELLKQMGIENIKTHLPSQCSGGEQQRCAIARAAINTPDILFADEPTGALNKHNTIEVLNLLTELNRKGQSILMVTHDARAALRADRLIYIEDGKAIGELELPKYGKNDEKSRELQVNSWLSSMGW